MSLLLATAVAAAIQPNCSWDRPGHNPYTGSTAAAIDRYTDIPVAVRNTLKRRIEDRQPDDHVNITRDAIGGSNKYDPTIHDMHFGAASVCASVTRSKWAPTRTEPGAVYCVGEHCILVPQICGNISRITKLASNKPPAPPIAAKAGTPVEFSDISLVDAEPHAEGLGPMDDDKPKRQRLADSRSGDGVDQFELVDELDLDDLSNLHGRNPGLGGGFDNGDNAVPTPVPEADTWAMLLSGLGLMGWMARRRAAAAAKATA